MTLNYFDNSKVSHLVKEYFELKFPNNIIPFKSTVLPIGNTHITKVFYRDQKVVTKKTETSLEDIMISGQFFRSYQFKVTGESRSFGISFHPTALFKILNTDISKLQNKHVPLSSFNKTLHTTLKPIIENLKEPKNVIGKLNDFFLSMDLTINKSTNAIDLSINTIKAKEGLLNVNDILEHLEISQKTLETQFKKIVGLTPGKYIRLYRFLKLMRKYESQEINIKDLIYMYNYYDRSHFSKDFVLFMKETPNTYFKNEHRFLNEYLNK